jgi:hypothetical protein
MVQLQLRLLGLCSCDKLVALLHAYIVSAGWSSATVVLLRHNKMQHLHAPYGVPSDCSPICQLGEAAAATRGPAVVTSWNALLHAYMPISLLSAAD